MSATPDVVGVALLTVWCHVGHRHASMWVTSSLSSQGHAAYQSLPAVSLIEEPQP